MSLILVNEDSLDVSKSWHDSYGAQLSHSYRQNDLIAYGLFLPINAKLGNQFNSERRHIYYDVTQCPFATEVWSFFWCMNSVSDSV